MASLGRVLGTFHFVVIKTSTSRREAVHLYIQAETQHGLHLGGLTAQPGKGDDADEEGAAAEGERKGVPVHGGRLRAAAALNRCGKRDEWPS